MSSFDLYRGRDLLARTPSVLDGLLRGLPRDWIHADEGEGTFSAYEVVGHLIEGERKDWIPRAHCIVEHGTARAFEPFDRFAHREASSGLTGRDPGELLDEFARLRRMNLEALDRLDTSPPALARRGLHPTLGEVELGQLLSTWVVHDLTHLAQVARVLAKDWSDRVGPWGEFLPILKR